MDKRNNNTVNYADDEISYGRDDSWRHSSYADTGYDDFDDSDDIVYDDMRTDVYDRDYTYGRRSAGNGRDFTSGRRNADNGRDFTSGRRNSGSGSGRKYDYDSHDRNGYDDESGYHGRDGYENESGYHGRDGYDDEPGYHGRDGYENESDYHGRSEYEKNYDSSANEKDYSADEEISEFAYDGGEGYRSALSEDEHHEHAGHSSHSGHHSHHGSSGHHRHHHHHRHFLTPKGIFMAFCCVFIILVVTIFVGWKILDVLGQRRLYANAQTTGPGLVQIEDEMVDENTGTKVDVEHWEEGWIRYKGTVYQYNDSILTFLVMGVDSTKPVAPAKDYISGGQADTLFLVVLNPNLNKLSLIAVNRNTMIDMEGFDADGNSLGTWPQQICLAHAYGDGMQNSCKNQVDYVSKLFYNLPIHGYCSINMGAISDINDAVGGVTVRQMSFENNEIVYGEPVTLMGKDAMTYVRQRGKAFNSATYRLEKQKEYITALLRKMMDQVRQNPTIVTNLYNTIAPYVVTSMGISELTYLAGQASEYSLDATPYSLSGNVIVNEITGFEEYIHDEQQLYDMMINVFYRKVK